MTAIPPFGPSSLACAASAGGDAPRLPVRTALAWSVALGLDHRQGSDLDRATVLRIKAALDAQASVILAQIVGPISAEDDLVHFRIALRRLRRCDHGGTADLREAITDVPFVYDLRNGRWSDGGLIKGEGVLAFLIWHAGAVLDRELPGRPVEREAAMARRALTMLGVAALSVARPPRRTGLCEQAA